MKKAAIIIVIIGVCLLIAGGAVFLVGMSKTNWDFSGLANREYVRETAVFSADEVNEIVVNVSTENVTFMDAEDDSITVEYVIVKNKNGKILREAVPVLTDGVLRCVEEEKAFSFMGFGFSGDKNIVVKVPTGKVLAVSVTVSTGDVAFDQASETRTFSALNVQTSTGKVTIKGKTACENGFAVETTTGKVLIEGDVTCGDATITTSTGEIKVSAPFTASKTELVTTTGDIDFSASIAFDSLTVETTTGDVSLHMAGKKEQYSYNYSASTGKSNVSSFTSGNKRIDITVSTGDIELYFAE